MKLLFAHDNCFIRRGAEVWSEGQFGADGWERYLVRAAHLTVVARDRPMPDRPLVQLVRSSRERVTFSFFEDMSNLRGLIYGRGKPLQKMRELVGAHDAVVARLPSEIGHLAVEAARAEGKPCWVEIVGCPFGSLLNHGGLIAAAYAPVAAARLRAVARRAEFVTYVTSAFLQRRYPSKAANSFAVSDVSLPPPDPGALEDRLSRIAQRRPGDPLTIGMIGTLQNRIKGLHVLLQALALARGKLPPVQLRVVGSGDFQGWTAEAERLGVADLVVFEGTIAQQSDVLRWLRAIDLYVQPSLQEGLPRALIEAMSQACPALASDVGGIPELLPASNLAPPGNPRALARLLELRASDTIWMQESARLNWQAACAFDTAILEATRQAFWDSFERAVGKTTSADTEPTH